MFSMQKFAIPAAIAGVLRGPGQKVPHGVLLECFLRFLGLKNVNKHPKSTLWGTPRQVPKSTQEALRGALSGPGP